MDVEWEIKYEDGTKDKVVAEKYDSRTGQFINRAQDVIASVNTSKVKLIRVLVEGEKSAR